MLGAPGQDGVFRYRPSPVEDNLPKPEDDTDEVADWFTTGPTGHRNGGRRAEADPGAGTGVHTAAAVEPAAVEPAAASRPSCSGHSWRRRRAL
jgi:hypothetical protein